MVEGFPSILVTKLFAPRWREGQVPRPHLLAALESGLQRRLILVSAAAGSGKTTLLVDWMRRHEQKICWLSLDARDSDPTRFLTYLIAALQTRAPNIGREALALLASPHPPTFEEILAPLINQLAVLPSELILVLDDYHVIEEQQTHQILLWLIAHLPGQVALVLLTRTDPPLPLARMRANRDMMELRAADLRFSLEHTARFLGETMGLALSPTQIRALHERTEGWIAGLQLAALALQQQRNNKAQFIFDFAGSHRHILDYLMEEVLNEQPENVRDFLAGSAPLHRFNASLCDAVMMWDESAGILARLERTNMFLVPLDQNRQWYRYHHLFAELLRVRLLATEPESVPVLQRRAAEWHERHGNDEEAIEYALAAGAFDHAARLIEARLAAIAWRAGVQKWQEWYRLFPPGFIEAYPHVAATFGQALAVYGRVREAVYLFGQVDPDKLPPYLSLMVTFMNPDGHDRDWLRRIAGQAKAQRLDPAGLLMLALVWGESGDYAEACQEMAKVHEESVRAGDQFTAWMGLMHQCRLGTLAGNLAQTEILCRMAFEQAGEVPEILLDVIPLAYLAYGRLLYERNDLAEAEYYLRKAIQQAEQTGFVMGVLPGATMLLAEVLQAQGDLSGATNLARLALEHAARMDFPNELEWLRTYEARLQLRQGNLTAASEWLRGRRPLPPSRFYPYRIRRLVEAEARLARREVDHAVAQLTELTFDATDLLTVEVWMLLALARHAQGDAYHASAALATALSLAEPEKRVRLFLNHGAAIAPLLRRFCEENRTNLFARVLLASLPDVVETSPLIEPLSERERDVLRRIAGGQSNREIAEALTVALSTVKWYVNELYGKLNVRSRTQAVARARELGMLEP